MIGLAIKLLGIRNAIARAFAWATQSAAHIFAVACLLAVAWGAVGWHGKRKAERVLATTEAAWRQASKDAIAAQERLNDSHRATNTAVNKGSTNDNAKGLSAARSAVAAYARLHPVNRCSPGEAKPATVPANPGVDAGTSGETGMVAVAVADLDTLAAGTVRAESCRAWGQSMIDAGLAEAGD